MSDTATRITALSLIAALAGFAPVRSVEAQSMTRAVPPHRVPVTVALVDQPIHGARGFVIRQRHDDVRNDVIVVVNDSMAPSRIAAAAALLTAVMSEEGDQALHKRLLRLPDAARGPRSEMRAANRVARKASMSPHVAVPEVGRARTTTIFLPDAILRKRLADRGVIRAGARPTRTSVPR